MKLFHGSIRIVKQPKFGYGKKYNDYGLGFYLTFEEEMANEWAVSSLSDGYTNCYEIDDSDLLILDLTSYKYSFMNWLAILLENRTFDVTSILASDAKDYILNTFKIEYKEYDVIIGYRADDSYFSFAQDFLNGAISYRQLTNAMKLGKLGKQYVLISEKAFSRLKFIESKPVASNLYYPKRMQRDRLARSAYFDKEKNKREKGDIYITDILDKEVDNNDPSLR